MTGDNNQPAPENAEVDDGHTQEQETILDTELETPSASDGNDNSEPSIEEQLEQALAQKDANWAKFVRAQADMENLRRRTRKEVDDTKVSAQSRVLREMLPVIDNLQRALAHAEAQAAQTEDPRDDAMLEGVRLVLRQFEQSLLKFDVKRVESKGQPFDPNFHEAASQLATADYPPGTVVDAMQEGYTIGDRLLRPALVVVATPAQESAEEPSGENQSAETEAETDSETGGEE